MLLKLTPEHRQKLLERIRAIFNDYAERGPDPGGETISLFVAEHPERQQNQHP